MNYDEFRSAICDSLRDAFPDSTDFKTKTVLKNNDHKKDAIIITMPGTVFSPTIYPENFYEMYETGHSIEDITSRIIGGCLEGYDLPLPSPDTLYDREFVKTHITFRLVSSTMNKALLSDIPYIPYHDLAIVFYCLLGTGSDTLTGFMIHKSHADYWEMTLDDMYDLAISNTPRLLPYELCPLQELLKNYLGDSQDICQVLDYTPDIDIPMYVMSNRYHVSGASSILYPDSLDSLAKKEGSDLIILPSSIHEIIIVPASDSLTSDYLNETIAAGNATITDPEELLSDHYYYYSRDRREVMMPQQANPSF